MLIESAAKLLNRNTKRPTKLSLAQRRDIPKILELYYKEGWIDWRYEDFDYLLKTSSNACFKLTLDDTLVGVSMATRADENVYYGHSNLIDSKMRDRINYFDEAVKYDQYLRDIARLCVLYAARRVMRMYQLGGNFIPYAEYRRATVTDVTNVLQSPRCEPIRSDAQWRLVYNYAKDVYGTERETLFQHFVRSGARGFLMMENDKLTAFSLIRELPKALCIGPVLADDDEGAMQVIAAAAKSCQPKVAYVEGEEKRLRFLLDRRCGIRWEDQVMTKMFRGDERLLEDENRIFGIFSRYIS